MLPETMPSQPKDPQENLVALITRHQAALHTQVLSLLGLEQMKNASAKLTDQASAALVEDLKQRGLLEDTLVIWGGEFARTPMGQGTGRDHHIKGFSLWMAGAGIKPGIVHGATDELGYNAVENIVHVRDLHATLLNQFGIDHARFSTKFQGLDYKLTGVEPAKAVKAIMA